jgi:polysaccharide pyruvyl transferase WcaK-like protein
VDESRNRPTIGIFGHYGNTNLGDEAIIAAILGNLRTRLPNATFYAFSRDPVDTESRHGVPSFAVRRSFEKASSTLDDAGRPRDVGDDQTDEIAEQSLPGMVRTLAKKVPGLRAVVRLCRSFWALLFASGPELRFCVRSARILEDVDLLIITGSNQFLDNFGGPSGYPYTLLKWAILARLTRTKLIFVSVGAGPLDAKLSKLFIRLALSFSSYTSFRDEQSMRLIESIGFKDSRLVFPDLAHSLDFDFPPGRETVVSPAPGSKARIGINPMPMYDSRYWCEADSSRYFRYVDELAKAASRLMREKYPVFFFGTQTKDENVIADIVKRLDSDVSAEFEVSTQWKRSQTVEELMRNIAEADLIIATRFHGAVLSLHAVRGVVAICYYRKTNDVMGEMGQRDYAIDFDRLDSDDLVERVKTLEPKLEKATEEIRRKNDEYRRSLDQQYSAIVEFAGPGGAAEA